MRKIAILGSLLVLVLAQAVCWGGANGGGGGGGVPNENNGGGGVSNENNSGGNSGDQSIGNINRVQSSVWSGPENSLSEVGDSRTLNNDDAVKITDGGKALLNFHNRIKLTLYNDTEAGGIYGELDPNTPNFVRMKLFRGGLLGEVAAKGSTAEISVAFGSTVKVIGTTFFVVYDEVTGYTSVGNFDGEVYFHPNGGDEIFLPPATMADISPEGKVDFYELPYDPVTFDSAADGEGSPVDGMKVLRKEFQQPQPGEGTPVEPTAAPVQTVTRYLVVLQGELFGPDLAERWSEDPDGYVIDFFLRKDVSLPDGSPFTSAYVKERLTAEWAYAREGRVELEVIDDYVIRFSLDSPSIFYVLDEMSKFGFEVQLGGPG